MEMTLWLQFTALMQNSVMASPKVRPLRSFGFARSVSDNDHDECVRANLSLRRAQGDLVGKQ